MWGDCDPDRNRPKRSRLSRKPLIQNKLSRTLPEPLTWALEGLAQPRSFEDGEAIYRSGDEAYGLFGVRSGRLQLIAHSGDGKPFVLTVLAPGEWFGELSLFDDLPRTHDTLAVGDCELWFVPKREFRALLRERPEFYAPFLEFLSHRVRLLFALIEDAMLLDLPQRLAKRVLELSASHGVASHATDADGEVVVDMHLPQEDLAAMVGATREAVGRHLKRWERKGWIRLAYGRIVVVDPSGLASIL